MAAGSMGVRAAVAMTVFKGSNEDIFAMGSIVKWNRSKDTECVGKKVLQKSRWRRESYADTFDDTMRTHH